MLDRGFDGFTMDDLAQAVGVSRRTLFNRVKDKASAVLGVEDAPVHAAIETFLAGGPTGRLAADAVHVVATVSTSLEGEDPDLVEQHQLREAAIAADAKVRRLTEEQFQRIFDELVGAVCVREHWPADDLRARTLGVTLLGMVRLAVDEISAGRADSFHAAFARVTDAHQQVLATA